MTRYKKDLGQRGEIEAITYLHKKGYKIIEQNYQTHWGELDIIALKDKKITFIEVKTRLSENFGKPYEAVNFSKVRKLMRPIQYFLLQKNYKNYKLSLDVISIVLNNDLTVKSLDHFENVGTN